MTFNKNLTAIKVAVESVRDNQDLKDFFAIVLKVGNVLNDGTNKGNATNFQIDLLTKLAATKGLGTFSKSSMLEFLMQTTLKS